MKRFIVGLLALVGALAVMAVLVLGVVVVVSATMKEGVEDGTIVELHLDGPLPEWVPNDPIARALLGERSTLRDVIDGIDRAAEDARVTGMFLHVGSPQVGLARIQEIREALVRFRDAGKPVVAWADSFGEFGPANAGYYVATVCDTVTMQPSGAVGFTGLYAESAFRRGLYDKFGIDAEMDQRHEYKNAMNVHTERAFTEPHREALEAVLRSMFGQMVAGVAEGRGLDEETVRASVDRAPLIGREAVDAGWIDGLAYRDEALAGLRERTGPGELLYLDKYLERAGRPSTGGRRAIAVVYGVGVVMRGPNGYDPLSGLMTMGSEDVAAAIRSAVDDRRVEAIVFRVDSPGGSYVASDTIWREVVRAREAGKPVVVSMGDVAASGGYFVSMHADRILAQPGTITASIGVLGGKLVTREMWGKIGVTFDGVAVGRNADMWSAQRPYSPSGVERRSAFLDGVYEDFTSRVAEGRGLDPERVGEIARGRVWSGRDALELGLVDELGGLDAAVRAAREEAGIDDGERVRIQVFPRPLTPFEALIGEGPDSSEDRVSAGVARVLERLRPWVVALERAGMVEPPASGVLMAPEPLPGP